MPGTVGAVSPVSRAGLLGGTVSAVSPAVTLKSGNALKSVVLTALIKVVKIVVSVPTLVVVESVPALGKSLVSLAPIM